jgi:hypothetical protein
MRHMHGMQHPRDGGGFPPGLSGVPPRSLRTVLRSYSAISRRQIGHDPLTAGGVSEHTSTMHVRQKQCVHGAAICITPGSSHSE